MWLNITGYINSWLYTNVCLYFGSNTYWHKKLLWNANRESCVIYPNMILSTTVSDLNVISSTINQSKANSSKRRIKIGLHIRKRCVIQYFYCCIQAQWSFYHSESHKLTMHMLYLVIFRKRHKTDTRRTKIIRGIILTTSKWILLQWILLHGCRQSLALKKRCEIETVSYYRPLIESYIIE